MSPLRVLWALLVAVLAIGLTAPAQAQNVTATKPESVAAVIRDQGFEVEVTKDRGGDPLLHAEGVGSSRVDLQACKLEYSIVSPK